MLKVIAFLTLSALSLFSASYYWFLINSTALSSKQSVEVCFKYEEYSLQVYFFAGALLVSFSVLVFYFVHFSAVEREFGFNTFKYSSVSNSLCKSVN